MTRFARRFRKVGRTLSRVELMRSSMDETFSLSPESLLDKDGGRRFLDFYGDEGLSKAFERYGLYDALRRRGYSDFHLETWAHDERHTLLIEGTGEGARHRLLDLVVRRDRLRVDPPGDAELAQAFDVLTVDWLTLRHPLGGFTEERLRLPGQEVPGLGIGERVMELLYRVVDRLSLGGLLTVAEYLHNAVLYARELPYVDPHYQGQLEALEGLLFEAEGLSFAQATWAMHWGYVIDVDDSVVRWRGEAMVKAVEPALCTYLDDASWRAHADRAEASLRYRLRRTAFDERWARERSSLLEAPEE
ncbi:MAG: hypothetical protein AB8I08_29050 [Sandaracinaceae bacterium]